MVILIFTFHPGSGQAPVRNGANFWTSKFPFNACLSCPVLFQDSKKVICFHVRYLEMWNMSLKMWRHQYYVPTFTPISWQKNSLEFNHVCRSKPASCHVFRFWITTKFWFIYVLILKNYKFVPFWGQKLNNPKFDIDISWSVPFCIFRRFLFLFAYCFKTSSLRSRRTVAVFRPKSRHITSPKRHFITKNDWLAKFLYVGVASMLNKVPNVSCRYLSSFLNYWESSPGNFGDIRPISSVSGGLSAGSANWFPILSCLLCNLENHPALWNFYQYSLVGRTLL